MRKEEASVRGELEEEKEGEHVVSVNEFFFEKIGLPLPITAQNDAVSLFRDVIPSQPLALSQSHRLIFVAHSNGFYVVRTKDAIDAAKAIKDHGTDASIQTLCLVDVPIGRVNILALSFDNSVLAASVGSRVDLFYVDKLLDKEVKPSYSFSVDNSSSVKDISWIRKSKYSFLVLSHSGKLYDGSIDGHFRNVMEDVDAVEWSKRGHYIAIAQKNTLSIMSSKFEERVGIPLSFNSWVDDSDDNCIVKVDLIKWVRPDSIVIGCIQLNTDGSEENYLIQVIKSREGKFTETSSKLVAYSYPYVYSGLIDDIVPYGSGPHLLLSYIEQCELAITANRKNTQEHIVLLGWPISVEDSDVAVIDMEQDKWLPRIELQENGDDNLILGLCVDSISLNEKIKVQIGVEEPKELSPCCTLLCLTLEGKLVMYHVASTTRGSVPPAPSDDEEEVADVNFEEDYQSVLDEQKQGGIKKEELNADSCRAESFNKETASGAISPKMSNEEYDIRKREVKSVVGPPNVVAVGQKNVASPNLYRSTEGQLLNFGQQSSSVKQVSSKIDALEKSSGVTNDRSLTAQAYSRFGSSKETAGILSTDPTIRADGKALPSDETNKESSEKAGLTGIQDTSFQPQSAGWFNLPNCSERKSPILPSSYTPDKSDKVGHNSTIPETSGLGVGMNDFYKQSGTAKFSGVPGERVEPKGSMGWGNIEPLPSFNTKALSTKENFMIGKSPIHGHPNSREDSLPKLGMQKSEVNAAKKFGTIKELTKELDILLEGIEGPGGFRDACTISQKSLVEMLEREIKNVSEKCRLWKTTLDQRVEEIHHILDNTVQVLARKVYIGGIVKQASDCQYWELWNRQKLSSELESKRRHIFELNQDLTNQLIELERHFNALEISKFGENGGHLSQGAFRNRFGPSRHIQSLHSLHNTMTSQLVAAEQLSECLSKQMDALSIELPSKKKQSVKRELFETIGIPYDASYSSPSAARNIDNSTSKQPIHYSGSAASKEKSRIKPITNEPETARRRRDSLDRSLASFEPTKTTVKRMLVQEERNPSATRQSFPVPKPDFGNHMPEELGFSHLRPSITTPILNQSNDQGLQNTSSKQATTILPPTSLAWNSPLSQRTVSSLSTKPASSVSSVAGQFNSRETGNKSLEKSSSGISNFAKLESISISENKPPTSLAWNSPLSQRTVSSLSTKPASSVSSVAGQFNSRETGNKSLEKSSSGLSNFAKLESISISENKPFMIAETSKQQKTAVSPSSSMQPQASLLSNEFNLNSKGSAPSEIDHVKDKPASQNSDFHIGRNLSSPLSLSVASSSTLTPESLPATSSIPSCSASTSTVSSSQSKALEIPLSPSTTSDSTESSIQTRGILSLESDVNATKQAAPLQPERTTGDSSLKLEFKPSPPSSRMSSAILSDGQSSFTSMASSASSVAGSTHPVQQSLGNSLFPALATPSASTVSVKGGGFENAITQEDDMEEEAPESTQATELGLGSLDGFGIGSSPISSAPKANPFGGSFSNAAPTQVSSPFSMPLSSGQLFRPASFTLNVPQPSQPSQSTNFGALSGGFGSGSISQAPSTGFGQPANIGQGQQALGSVLGSFGQSRQLGPSLPGTGFGGGLAGTSTPGGGFGGGFASAATGGGFGGGFASAATGSGFASAATGGGFASAASGSGGFGGAAGGGFAVAASGSGGYGAAAGGGFAGAASGSSGFGGAAYGSGSFSGAAVGGGFGAFNQQGAGGFSGQPGAGGFSAFGSTAGGSAKPSELFTQIRK